MKMDDERKNKMYSDLSISLHSYAFVYYKGTDIDFASYFGAT